ncbi:CAP domain-containing protein [Paracoccus sp. (in: a-proteobacteria)]|uniref:CAP domain-containing protein n=1 Tax=Paracoccus sp. TaxID=267 RepID=UPI0026DEE8BD|nr:CAP domain-containing protein [Paracoccus sp. (in: a-proteobacteria)]MDO5646430.1 CAP domain-containing protein [Paracoccus sp. (in: a-proteobacteria)]
MPLPRFAVIASLSVLAACDAPVMTGATPEPPAEQALAAECVGDPGQGAALSDAVNAVRRADGKTVLTRSDTLDRIAQSHACDMAQRGRADVAGSNGSSVVDRARAVNYPACGVVQLVAVGGAPSGVVAGWMGRAATREQVLGQLSYDIGGGTARGRDGRVWHSVVLGNNCR